MAVRRGDIASFAQCAVKALAALSLLLLPPPLAAQPGQTADCAALAAERAGIAEELSAVREEIGDIATGKRPRKTQRISGGDVARRAAGAAAGLLLPFPFGLAAGAGVAAAKNGKPKPEVPGPDVPALIERRQALEARLAALADAPCT